METQAYCMINPDNVCDNVCMWDGDTNIWQPPVGYTMLVQATTPAMVWEWNASLTPPDWNLVEQVGAGTIWFTWDGKVLTTNEPKPQPAQLAPNQPITTGTQTL